MKTHQCLIEGRKWIYLLWQGWPRRCSGAIHGPPRLVNDMAIFFGFFCVYFDIQICCPSLMFVASYWPQMEKVGHPRSIFFCVSLFFLCVCVFRHLRLHWVTRMPCSCRLRPSSCTWGWTEHTEQAQCDRHSERKPETVRQKLQQCDKIWSKADAMFRQNYNTVAIRIRTFKNRKHSKSGRFWYPIFEWFKPFENRTFCPVFKWYY